MEEEEAGSGPIVIMTGFDGDFWTACILAILPPGDTTRISGGGREGDGGGGSAGAEEKQLKNDMVA